VVNGRTNDGSEMNFSLIMATVGRTQELEHFLNSLIKQTGISFELIVVDQNPDDRLVPILERYQHSFPITRVHSEKGLSKARNIGLKYTKGDIVAFPDDDCEYPTDTLRYVKEKFERDETLDGLTGRSVTAEGLASIGRFSITSREINKATVWLQGISFTIFLRAKSVHTLSFDETLGVGAKWGSGEETDFLLQTLAQGAKIVYDPNLKIIHPPPPTVYTPQLIQKEYAYGLGMGRVLQKHKYSFWFKANLLFRPLAGVLVALARFNILRARGYWCRFLGRWQGLISK
jgi:glycosyltransferase involved in cell wall biosynthesis